MKAVTPKVTIVAHTQDAENLLLFTKYTRLAQDAALMEQIRNWPPEKKAEELDYVRKTIQSSFEFVDYTFCIEGVSRAFTHQLVRTRTASFQQQSQRTVDMEGFDYIMPKAFKAHDEYDPEEDYALAEAFDESMDGANDDYHRMKHMGATPQDARGVLPTNIATNIIMKCSLRTLGDMAKLRLCTRTQGEYQDVFKLMRAAVLEIHPWAEPFIRVHCAALGVCAFPNYKECPIKGGLFNADTGQRWDESKFHYNLKGGDVATVSEQPVTRDEQQMIWQDMEDFEAIPQEQKK